MENPYSSRDKNSAFARSLPKILLVLFMVGMLVLGFFGVEVILKNFLEENPASMQPADIQNNSSSSGNALTGESPTIPASMSGRKAVVISPNGREDLKAGETYILKWNILSSVLGIRVDLVKVSTTTFTFRYNIWSGPVSTGIGGRPWDIPSDIPAGSGYKISLSDEFGILDESDKGFSIIPSASGPSPSQIYYFARVISPKGGEVWQRGKTYKIEFGTDGSVPLVTLSLADVAKATNTAFAEVAVTGKSGNYDWTIPNNVPAGANYKIYLISGTKGVLDSSEKTFTIN